MGMSGIIYNDPAYVFNYTGGTITPDYLQNSNQTLFGTGTTQGVTNASMVAYVSSITFSGGTGGSGITITLTTTGSTGPSTYGGGFLNIPIYSGTTISLTTTGNTGAATFAGNILNVPQYLNTTYSGATPTGFVSLSGTSGVSINFMRSDAAPALDQTIIPTWTGLHTFKQVSTGGTSTDVILISPTNPATSAATVQWSPKFHQQGLAWNPTALASQTVDFYSVVQTTSSNPVNGVWSVFGGVNGGAATQVFTVDNFGDWSVYNSFFINKTNIGATSTDGLVFNQFQAATLGTQVQKSTRIRFVGGVWNSGGTAAANTFGYIIEGNGIPGLTPTSSLDFSTYLSASTTPTFTKRMSLDAATGNLSLLTGGLNLSNTGKISIGTGTTAATAGVATLIAGTVTVSTTSVTANSLIYLTYNTPLGTLAAGLSQGTITPGTSFVINSLTTAGLVNTTDTSRVNWFFIN